MGLTDNDDTFELFSHHSNSMNTSLTTVTTLRNDNNNNNICDISSNIASIDLTDYSQICTTLPLAVSTPTSNVLSMDFFRSEQEIADDFFKTVEQLVYNFVNRPNCLFPYYRVMRWTTDNREHFVTIVINRPTVSS